MKTSIVKVLLFVSMTFGCCSEVQSAAPNRFDEYFDAMYNDLPRLEQLLEENQPDVSKIEDSWKQSLIKAAICNMDDTQALELLLKYYSGINVIIERGLTLLHIAAECGCAEKVEVLLRAGATVDCRAEDSGDTPLHLAARNRCCETVRTLLEGGASTHKRNSEGKTALYVAEHEVQFDGDEYTGRVEEEVLQAWQEMIRLLKHPPFPRIQSSQISSMQQQPNRQQQDYQQMREQMGCMMRMIESMQQQKQGVEKNN